MLLIHCTCSQHYVRWNTADQNQAVQIQSKKKSYLVSVEKKPMKSQQQTVFSIFLKLFWNATKFFLKAQKSVQSLSVD